jgi:hypothetical protein
MSYPKWDSMAFTSPQVAGEIEKYLESKSPWTPIPKEGGPFGFGNCAQVEKTPAYVRVYVMLQRKTLLHTMLTFSFFLQDLNRDDKRPESGLSVFTSCGGRMGPSIGGWINVEFKRGLGLLSEIEQDDIVAHMRQAWSATAPPPLKKYARDCYLRIHDERFQLGCFGNACDMCNYPDNDPEFSCHNLDTPYQQATLLAGLASLSTKVSSKL